MRSRGLEIKWGLFLAFWIGMSAVQASNVESFKSLKSPWMELLPENSEKIDGAYPWWAKALQSDAFKMDPSGVGLERGRSSCDPQLLAQKKRAPPAQFLGEIESFFKSCEPAMRTSHTNIISNTWETLFLRLHPRSHPLAQHVIFHMPGGVRLKGLLAMKSDGKPRPLVILRLGIFSNTEEFFPERYLFMQLFEQSPFHVLVLESLSGSEYVKHNSSFAIGGFEEGFQNFWIAKKLQDPQEPISRRIDSVHLAGVSLGGNGTFFAALLNQFNARPISSFLGFCPLVQFEETFDFHRAQGWSMKAMNYWASKRLTDLQKVYPELRSNDFISGVLTHLKREKSLWPDEYMRIRWPGDYKKRSFSERLRFWSEWKGIQTPFLVFATRQDPIVPYEINAQKIVNGDIDVGRSQLKIITLEEGYHCSLPAAYDWKAMTTVLQSYIQNNSKAWRPVETHWRTRFTISSLDEIRWDVRPQGIFLVRPKGWFSQDEEEFPLKALSFYHFEMPLSSEARSLLKRWLNQNVRISPISSQSDMVGTDLSWDS